MLDLVRSLVKALFRRSASQCDLDAELQSHIAIETRQRVERGESPQSAHEAAMREFGNIGLVAEVTRDMARVGLVTVSLRRSTQSTASPRWGKAKLGASVDREQAHRLSPSPLRGEGRGEGPGGAMRGGARKPEHFASRHGNA